MIESIPLNTVYMKTKYTSFLNQLFKLKNSVLYFESNEKSNDLALLKKRNYLPIRHLFTKVTS